MQLVPPLVQEEQLLLPEQEPEQREEEQLVLPEQPIVQLVPPLGQAKRDVPNNQTGSILLSIKP